MKAFIACLAIVAATAEPQWLHGSPLVHSLASPLTYAVKPIEYKKVEFKPVEYKTVEYKPIEYKQMEIKPVEYKTVAASPMIYNQAPLAYSHPLTYSHMPLAYNMMPLKVKSYANDREMDKEYAAKGEYVAENAGAIHIAKRDAEADPQFLAYSAMPYAHSTPYWNGMPYTYNAMPVAYKTLPYAWTMPQVKTLDDARMKVDTPDYAGKGQYVAESAGAIHIAKREAEADPQFLAYGAMPYTTNYWNGVASPYYNTYNTAAAYWNPLTTYRSAYNYVY